MESLFESLAQSTRPECATIGFANIIQQASKRIGISFDDMKDFAMETLWPEKQKIISVDELVKRYEDYLEEIGE